MSIAEELEKLQSLRDRGVISEQEFGRAKAQVLDAAPVAGDTRSFLQRAGPARAAIAFSAVSAAASGVTRTCRRGPGA